MGVCRERALVVTSGQLSGRERVHFSGLLVTFGVGSSVPIERQPFCAWVVASSPDSTSRNTNYLYYLQLAANYQSSLEIQNGMRLAPFRCEVTCLPRCLLNSSTPCCLSAEDWITVKNFNKVVVAALLTLILSGFASAQTVFSVVTVPGSSPHSLIAINNSGQVVVNTGTSESYQVSVWNRLSGAQVITLIGTNSGGAAINNVGDVVGAADPDGTGNLQAFVWQPTSGVQWPGFLGGDLSVASGINDAGAVVGMAFTAADEQHAFLWTSAAGMQDLTPDLTNIGGATAVGVNSSNQVVGYYFPDGSLNTLGFIWTQAGGLQNLGLAGTLAYAINNSGTVVGQTPAANGYEHAFSWTQAGGIKDLGTLNDGESSALSINANGWVVGNSLMKSQNGFLHGFLWTPSAGMKDFTKLSGLTRSEQVYFAQVNDFGVVALSTNRGGLLLVPKITGTVTSSANPSALGQPVTFTVTVTSIAGPPPDGETVQFTVSGKTVGSATLKAGVAQFTTSAITVGSHPVVATYSGDANYLPTTFKTLRQVVK